MRLPRVYLYLVVILAVSNCAVGLTNQGYVQTSEMGWFEARRSCIEERNTDLFVPSETGQPPTIPHALQNTYYWVGGVETSQWRWTDNSPLFTNIGLCDVPIGDDVEIIQDTPGNSVLECYRRCNKYKIGLFGSSCYCLEETDLHVSTCSEQSGNAIMCFGNPKDQCGTDSRMSVYEIDVPFTPETYADYQCAYSSYSPFSNIEVTSYNCDVSLSSICLDEAGGDFKRCHHGICVSNDVTTWTLSNQSCSLAKFAFSKETYFHELQYTIFKYWIGLHKQRFRNWIDGKEVQMDFENTDSDQRCLALMKTDDEWLEYWIPCNGEHRSLCSSREHSEHTDTTDTTTETSSVPVKGNGNHGTSSQTTAESRLGGNDGLKGNGNGRIGIFVGVGIGCVFVLAVIGITIVLKRKGKFCFRRQEKREDHPIAMDNTVYLSPIHVGLHNDHGMRGSVPPGYVDTRDNQRRPGNDNFTCKEDNDYNTTIVKSNVDTGNNYNHLGVGEDNYDTAGVNRIDNVQDNTYNHTETYIGSNVMVDNEHETCNHTGKKHYVNDDKGQSRQTTETYNHLDIGSGSGESVVDADQCYDHLMSDVDNDYDTTRLVIDSVQNDTYNHTVSVGESQSPGRLSVNDGFSESSSDYYNL